MKKNIVMMSCCLLVLFACGTPGPKRPSKNDFVRVSAGTNVPSIGMAIDANYDKKTDGLIPGYKILSVAITNNGIDAMQIDKMSDEWYVTDMNNSKHKATIDLRDADPKVYSELPERIKALIEYPLIIQVGDTQVVDLLFKSSVILDSFRNVRFICATNGKRIEIIPGY